MSQIYKAVTAGSLPPVVPVQFNTQNGNAVPAGNILIVNGFDSTENNDNGIITKGGVVGTGTANEVDVVLTNRLQGTSQTVGTGTGDIITFIPLAIGTYAIEYRVAAYNTTSLLGAGYNLFGAIRYDGVNSNICDPTDEINNEEGTMSGSDVGVIVSGSNIILRATGYAGQTINWSAVAMYTFIGV